ncbi:DnaJ domain-containing protein [Tistlia consotensis]|uniref:DnaJ domain-containing protein n=1 Tax=Tistlia consotensis USBA 355 TaxID=560819 RepID=A0A1Y6C2H5_9PROT|nr:J domain-containing protein [Tistlia consotensis]SMF33274.1 DnaJ domain-containing protein [Tistlia consotensis USBA 355]SNR69618.1 DnaJ domain-containing protein [Tistlia consotensis]
MASSCQEALNSPFDRAAPQACAHPGCAEPGDYRAPVARDRLNDYMWFCLEHVRAYNSGWDYFAGLSADQIEQIRRQDCTWGRPTWKLGGGPYAEAWKQGGPFHEDPGRGERRQRARRSGGEEAKALEVLGLEPGADWAEVRSRYKELAKRLHPDRTGGDRASEERLKRVNRAYATLKALHAASRAS